jgi:hypothetical protein
LTPLTQSIDKALLTLSLLDLKHLEQITAGNDQEKSAYIELLIENRNKTGHPCFVEN